MGFYSNFIFPRLCDLALGSRVVSEHRSKLLSEVRGTVLEIGFGTGLNLPHYPKEIREITAIDPNGGAARIAQKRIAEAGIAVDLRRISGEQLPFDPESFDCVVSTFTLCSIEDVHQAMCEVIRVLRPNGKFLFLEHGISPDPKVQLWERRLNGLQQWFGDGCHLTRNIGELVASQPFASVDSTESYLEKVPKTHGYIYRGFARK